VTTIMGLNFLPGGQTANAENEYRVHVAYCSFRAQQIIDKTSQYQQTHSSAVMYFTHN
jgi:hypothetical protein